MLGASPETLAALPRWGTSARWTATKVAFWMLTGPLLIFGCVLFWFPYRVPGWIVARLAPGEELRATYKALVGFAALVVWIAAAGLVLAWFGGAVAGLLALIVLPLFAAGTLMLRDRWHDSLSAARRFLQLRRHGALRAILRERQRVLALQLAALVNSKISHSPAPR